MRRKSTLAITLAAAMAATAAVAAATAKPAALHLASLGAAADLAFGGLPARAFGHGAFGANAWAGAGAARENLFRRV